MCQLAFVINNLIKIKRGSWKFKTIKIFDTVSLFWQLDWNYKDCSKVCKCIRLLKRTKLYLVSEKRLRIFALLLNNYWCTLLAYQRTIPPNRRNPVHVIARYWLDFQSLNSHWNFIIFKKTFSKSCSSWLHASFDTFWVQIDWLRY